MMEQFPPFTRRLVAIALLFLAILALVNLLILPLSGWMSSSLAGLADARFQLARLEAVRGRPAPPETPPMPAGLTLSAANPETAVQALVSSIRAGAANNQVQVDGADPVGQTDPQAHVVEVSLSVRGEQSHILSFINALERGTPTVRFRTWSVMADESPPISGPTQLTFQGVATAVWEPDQ